MVHAAVHTGFGSAFSVIISQGWYKTLIFIVAAPVMGLVLGLLLMTSIYWIFRHKSPPQIDKWFSQAAAAFGRRPTVWAMEVTTPRKRWALSPVHSTPEAG